VPPAVLRVLRELGTAGRRSWVVGGAVRDLLLGRERHDPNEFDVATPATPEEVTRLFRRVLPTGIEHGTVTVLEGGARVEVTTFRGEGAYVDGRRPSSVTFHTDLEADLARRDFTVNAIAWDPLAAELRDPCGGLADLRRRVIRAVGDARERFAEDGLRPLRALRFASELGFHLEPRTRGAIRPALAVVRQVSKERVAEELSRLLTGAHAASALPLLERTGLLGEVLSPLAGLSRARVRHAVAVAAAVRARPGGGRRGEEERERCRLLRLAGLLHVVPGRSAMQAVVELRLPNRLAVGVAEMLGAGPCLSEGGAPFPESPAEVRRWLSGIGAGRAEDVLGLWEADARHQGAASRRAAAKVRGLRRRVSAALRARPPLAIPDLALDGRAVMRLLGISGGPAVGEALRHLLELVLEDPAQNEASRLEAALRDWRPAHGGGAPA